MDKLNNIDQLDDVSVAAIFLALKDTKPVKWFIYWIVWCILFSTLFTYFYQDDGFLEHLFAFIVLVPGIIMLIISGKDLSRYLNIRRELVNRHIGLVQTTSVYMYNTQEIEKENDDRTSS